MFFDFFLPYEILSLQTQSVPVCSVSTLQRNTQED